MQIKSATISNETMMSSSSTVMSLLLWRHCSGELKEYLVPSEVSQLFCQFFCDVIKLDREVCLACVQGSKEL